MRQIRGGVTCCQKVPKRFGNGESAELKTDGAGTSISNLGNDLVIFTILICKTFSELDLIIFGSLVRFSDIPIDYAPKLAPPQETKHSLSPKNIVCTIHGKRNRVGELGAFDKKKKEKSGQTVLRWLEQAKQRLEMDLGRRVQLGTKLGLEEPRIIRHKPIEPMLGGK